jgi:hypothetical protein
VMPRISSAGAGEDITKVGSRQGQEAVKATFRR